jgi:hypothetical protein
LRRRAEREMTIIYEVKVTVAGNSEPELVGTFRLFWNEQDETMDEAIERFAKQACHRLHKPKAIWTAV